MKFSVIFKYYEMFFEELMKIYLKKINFYDEKKMFSPFFTYHIDFDYRNSNSDIWISQQLMLYL